MMAERITKPWSELLVFGFFAAGLCAAPAVRAQDTYTRLDESNIAAFIHETSDITSGITSGMPVEAVADYLDLHLEKNARFKSVIKYSIPGFPPQETIMSLSKKEFIKNIKDSDKAISNYANEIRITDINISKDGQRATVKTEGREQGVMPVAAEGEAAAQDIPIEGVSACNQIISLSEAGVIQMYGAQCVTMISFSELD